MPKRAYIDLKFDDQTLSGKAIRKLTTELGFDYHSRNIGKWIIYRRWLIPKPTSPAAESNVIQLPDLTKRTPVTPEDGPVAFDAHAINDATALILNRECISICETFYGLQDVTREEVAKAIRAFSYSKGNPAHRAWIQDWVVNNIDNVTNDELPW